LPRADAFSHHSRYRLPEGAGIGPLLTWSRGQTRNRLRDDVEEGGLLARKLFPCIEADYFAGTGKTPSRSGHGLHPASTTTGFTLGQTWTAFNRHLQRGR
jgi:hypothetical protein